MTPQELRASIIQQAIQGKLVEQRPEEGTGEELFKQIQAEKQALIKAGKIKKEKPLPKISEEEVPFEIPDTWRWARWGDLSNSIQYGYNAAAQEIGRIKMVRISDIQNGKVMWETVPFCDIAEDEISSYLLAANDILFARTGGTVGKSYLVKDVPEDAIYAGYLIRTQYSSLLCPEYMKHFMESKLYWDQLRNGTIATAQPNCNGKTLAKMILPLPPLAEQKRIVTKLEEILPLIDRYEVAWNKLEEFNKRFPGDMQKSILQLAMQGKLVAQDANEDNQRNLFKQVQMEYQRSKPLPTISEDEIPYDIPDSWFWVRLGDALIIERGGSPRPIKDFITNDPNGINWIKIGDTEKGGKYINATQERIIPEGMKKSRYVQKGDFLLSNSMSFGRPYILNIDGCIHDGWLVLRPVLELFDKDYLYYLLSSPMVFAQFCSRVAGAVVNNLNSDKVALTVVPVPPLAEQKRIVAKLEEILPLCDRLK